MTSRKLPLAFPYTSPHEMTDLVMQYEDLVIKLINLMVISPTDVEYDKKLLDQFLSRRLGYDVRSA